MTKNEYTNGNFTAKKVGDKTVRLEGVNIFRHESGGIAIKVNGELTSVNDDPSSVRGNASLYGKLNAILKELDL